MKTSLTLIFLGAALLNCSPTAQAAIINISDTSLTPDGTNAVESLQTDIATPNGGNVLSANGDVVYHVTKFTFGANSNAHYKGIFNATGGQSRLGVEINDDGLIQFASTGDPGRTSVNLATDLAGTTVTLLVKQHYDTTNDSLRTTQGTSDDTLMTVWVNPDGADVEGSGIAAGDMHTLWNSRTYGFFTHEIQNQSTPGTAGESFIAETTILTGSDATFANALALAVGSDTTAPTPDPMTWASAPAAVGAGSITMAATEATDASGVEYFFTETSGNTGGSNSGWQDSPIYTDTGLSANTTYSYTVKARDKSAGQNETQTSSPVASATTDAPAGPVNADNSTLVAYSSSVPANGIATTTIIVTLKDGSGTLIAGEGVTLTDSPSNATINPAGAQATDLNGQATFTVSSSTIGTVTFSATSSTDGVTVSETANVEFVDPATATAYNVNFLDEGQAVVSGLVGVVGGSGETWNQGTVSVSNLVDATGAFSSTVSVSGLGDDGRTLPSAGLSAFNGSRGFFGKGLDTTVTISGLSADTAYDLYIYALSPNSSSWGDITSTERAAGDFVTTNTVLGNGQSQWLDNATTGTDASTFVPNGNYVAFQSIVADGSGNISILVDAHDGIDGNSATNDGNCRLQVNALQIRPASGMSVDYATWRDNHYPGLGLPGEDDDGDSLSNDYERLFGLDPTDSASIRPLLDALDPNTGSFSYSRRSRTLANMNYKIWYSTDLEEWFEDNAASQTLQSVMDDIETMGVTIDPALLSEDKLFIQMRATEVAGVDVEPSLVNLWGNGNTINLLFSEPMNPSSAGNADNYTVQLDGGGELGVTDATLSSDGGRVTLTLDTALGTATGYTVSVDAVNSSTGQSLGANVSRQFTTWDNDPSGIKVFILAGQSNMVGFGEVEVGNSGAGTIGSLRYMAINNGSYPEYDYTSLLEDPGQPSTSPFATRPDVKVWYRDGGNTQLGGAILKGDLGPPYMGRDSGKIGPEFAFGQILGNHYGSNDVLVIKCAWGGRDLAEKFRPPSAVADRGGQVGLFYSAIIDYTREVLTNLDSEFPAWSGQGYEIVGFGWHQGYNDRIDTAFSNEYKDNLPDLISDLREVFNKPNMPFVIASTGMAAGAAEPAPYSGYTTVEKAQLWVAGVAQPANTLSTDTRPFWRESSVSPSGQGHHWNSNAESYFRIGKAMGDNMVNLLSAP